MVSVDGGNTFRQATSIGTAVLRPNSLATLDVNDALSAGSGETVDWFRFRVRGRSSSRGASTTLVLSADKWISSMTLYKESRGKPGRRLAQLDPVNGAQDIKALTAGKYFIKIAGNAPPVANASEGFYLGRVQILTPPANLFN